MSQQGFFGWYTNTEIKKLDPRTVIKEVANIVGIHRAESVYRDDLKEHLANDVLGSEIHRLFLQGTELSIQCDLADMGDRVERALEKIPKKIRGNFVPNRPFFNIGGGVFYDSAIEDHKGVKYTVMVGLWGPSTPNDTTKMRETLIAMPELHAEKVRLEHVIGSLETALYLSF